MLSFIRPDLNQVQAYTPHPGGNTGEPVAITLDRLDSNECPYDLPVNLKQKLASIYQDTIETNRYPDGSHTQLKGAIAQYVNESAKISQVNSQNISVGNGSDELIRSLLIATCLGNHGSILVADPTFSMYEIIAKTLGINTVKINRHEKDFSIDIEEANQALQQSNPPIKVVFVVHPNSPTANALNPQEIAWLKTIPEDIMVVIDEAYFEFCQHTLVTELSQHNNWVILRTFSKAFRLASLRLGYAIALPAIIENLEKVRLPYNIPSFSLCAGELVLSERQELLQVIPEILEEKRKILPILQTIPALQIWPSDGNFIYARLTNEGLQKLGETSQDAGLRKIMQVLKTQGSLIRHTGGGLRLTIGSSEQNQRLLERIKMIFAN
jgi:histidinol-phosphate aminotransferase